MPPVSMDKMWLLGWVFWQGVGSTVTIPLSQAATSSPPRGNQPYGDSSVTASSPGTPAHSQNHASQGCRGALVSLPCLGLDQQCPPRAGPVVALSHPVPAASQALLPNSPSSLLMYHQMFSLSI